MKKKILFLIPSLRVGGAEKVCCSICDNLNYQIFEVYLVSISDQIPLAKAIKHKSNVRVLTCNEPNPLRFPWFSIKSLKIFYGYVREIKPDVVHSHLWGLSCRYLYLFLFFPKKPLFIATIHSSEFIYTSKKNKDRIFKFIENTSYRFLNFNLVSISPSVSSMIQRNLYFKTLSIVNNGIDTTIISDNIKFNNLKEELNLINNFPIIIHVGRASFEKRQEDIIKALPAVLRHFPRTKLLLVGRDNTLMFSGLTKELGVDKNILLLDERFDVQDLLSICDLGIFPSLFEGHPLALIEMMAARLPLIVSEIQTLKEITGYGLAAVYVPVKSPYKISDAIIQVLKNPKLMNKISSNARKIAVERYSLISMKEKYEVLYQTLG